MTAIIRQAQADSKGIYDLRASMRSSKARFQDVQLIDGYHCPLKAASR